MKIRWNGASVRLRISPSELDDLIEGRVVSEELRLGENGWRTEFARADATRLVFVGATLYFSLSETDCDRLAQPETEGVYFSTPDGLRFYVEKDFPCAHPRAEEAREQSETFEAPSGFVERKNTVP